MRPDRLELSGDLGLQAYFTRRTQAAAIVAGVLSLATLAALHSANPVLFGRLTGRALPLVILAGVCGLAVLALLITGRRTGIRVIAALGVAAVIWGWGVAQYPVLLPGTAVTLANAGAPHATLTAIVVLFVVAALIIGPSFALLFTLQNRRLLRADEHGAPATAAPAGRTGRPTAQPQRLTPEHRSPVARGAVLVVVAIAAITRRLRRH